MSGNVKPPRRPYESPRRREQAAATRQAILEAAERRFAERGYVGTSVAEIAEEARVALKTVYAVFGSKADVLRALWNLRMRGDEEPVPMPERPWYRGLVDEPDAKRRLALVARNSRVVRERTAHVTEIVRQAAPADEQIAALWERFQREFYEVGVRGIVETLERDGVLAGDVTTAADIGWTLTHPDLYQLLVRRRGWSPEAYERWLAETLCAQLIDDGADA
ncbi:MAG TPA: helix-turn-helix domain-containing protein [Gaiellaceae bacterium]|nr:helix-turn-helix domain-containing protein [Gaiellaceae bacterium]